MHGFEWKDIRGVEGTGFVRAIRTILTKQLPELLPVLNHTIADHVGVEINRRLSSEGNAIVPLYDTCKKMVTRLNCVVFFGHALAKDAEFFEAAYKFPHDSAYAAEFIRLLPRGISSALARFVTSDFKSSKTLHRLLTKEITRRLEAKQDGVRHGPEISNDGLQWLIDTAPQKEVWGVERLVGEVMGIWYGSVHTLSIAVTYALIDLYSHPEYVDSLRKEIAASELLDFHDAKKMPLLDSFMSESARISAFESSMAFPASIFATAHVVLAAVRRQALQAFTFHDGLRINAGDWVCVPHRSMMRDNDHFADALTFDGRRFLEKTGSSARTTYMTDCSPKWLVWGIGRILW
jgi:cytochrome P450